MLEFKLMIGYISIEIKQLLMDGRRIVHRKEHYIW